MDYNPSEPNDFIPLFKEIKAQKEERKRKMMNDMIEERIRIHKIKSRNINN
jgi:hypothetical protein